MTSREPGSRAVRQRAAGALALLVAVVLGLALEAGSRQGITADEPLYLRFGAHFVETGDLTRVARSGVAPLPILLTHVPAVLLSSPRVDSGAPNPACGPGRSVLRRARALQAGLVGIPLLLAVFAILARRRGVSAGVVGAALVALSPSVLAGLSLATTDAWIALLVLLAVMAMDACTRSGSAAATIAVSVCVGLAIAAKLTGLLLVPIAAAVVAAAPAGGAGGPGALARRSARAVVTLLGAFCVCWAVSGFQTGVPSEGWLGTPAFLHGRSVPAVLLGLLRQIHHAAEGHPSFLLGSRRASGWWSYYPVVFAIKSSPAELLLLVPAAALVVRGLRRDPRLLPRSLQGPTLWLGVGLVYGASLLASSLDLGHRYLLVLYPLLVCLGVEGLWRLVPRPGARVAAAAGLVLLQAVSAAAARPDYPQYFNAFAGGPEQGYRWVVDSNVDWGQDLPALEQTLAGVGERLGHPPAVLLFYFGKDCPGDYAIARTSLAPGAPRPELVALSATYLQGVYVGDAFRAFRSLAPVARAGASIFLYDYADRRVQDAVRNALTVVETSRRHP